MPLRKCGEKTCGAGWQHYGWLYDYKARAITPDMHVGPLPDWLARLAKKLYDQTELFEQVPEQVIVNEYKPGQGIATHTDHPGFGPTVCTISLLDDWEMDFSENWKDKSPALLQRGSCVLMTDEARHVWQHGIAPRKSELNAVGKARSEPPIVTDVQDGTPSRNSDGVVGSPASPSTVNKRRWRGGWRR